MADALPMRSDSILSSSLTLPQIKNSVQLLSELASAWAKVSKRLPQSGEESQSDHILVIGALRLALGWLAGAPVRADGRDPSHRCVQLAALLADLCAAGLPLDAPAISAGVLLEAAETGFLDHDTIANKLGPEVAKLVHDVLRVRTAPRRVELYDDTASSAIREWCIAFNDIRASVVEVVSRWDELRCAGTLPAWDRQALALEALQVYAPLGHALGLGTISAAMEDLCFQILFPGSYAHTAEWLHTVVDPAEGALFAAQQQLLSALDAHPRFNQLASGCVLRARTKSLFSMMRKMLRLGDLRQGGRQKEQVFDLLGMRAVVQPRPDLPAAQAEAAAQEACYVVEEVASALWQAVPDRTKDYIAHPKSNGYRSIHLTVRMDSVIRSQEGGSSSSGAGGMQPQDAEAAQHAEQPHSWSSSASSSSFIFESGSMAAGSQSSLQPADSSSMGVERPVGLDGSVSAPPHESSLTSLSMSMASWDGSSSDASSTGSTSSMTVSTDGEDGMLVAPYMELQIRTQAMDDRAESGEAAHAAYKGGLDVRQARQLQAWTRELQHRLAVRPQGKLLLPPSVVARAEGAASMLESVDLDADGPDVGAAPVAGGASAAEVAAGAGAGAPGTAAAVVQGAAAASLATPASPEAQRGPKHSSSSTARARATETLFRFMDRNGDGVVSVDEIKAQLEDMCARPLWASPYGAITFDPAADMSALSTGSIGSMDVWASFTGSQAPGVQPAAGSVPNQDMGPGGVPDQATDSDPDLDVDTLYHMVAPEDGELSLEDFKAFIKQASLLRARKREQQEKQALQEEQQQPPHPHLGGFPSSY